MDVYERLTLIGNARREQPALSLGDTRLTYAQLIAEVDLMAQRYAHLGISKGSSVVVLSNNRPEVMVAYYAAARTGAVFVPVNPVLSSPEVAHVVRHSGATMLFYDSELADKARAASLDPERRWTFEGLASIDACVTPSPSRPPDSAGDFLVIYTSGSTGVPKAVVFEQSDEIAGNAALIDMWGLTSADVTLVALPLGFLYGLSTAAATGLQAGGKVVLLPKFRPRDVLYALVEERVSVFHGVPTMFAMMLNFAETEGLNVDLSRVRLMVSAGAPLAEDLRDRFRSRFGKRIDDYYALTEARPVFGRRFDDPAIPPRGAIGKAAPGVDVQIVGEGGRVLGANEQGELVLRDPGMFRRYAKEPEITSQALGPLGFRSGDLGYYDDIGYYYLMGRSKDIIIRGGANIAPAEVENVLVKHPSVELAGVVGALDSTFGEVVAAFITLRKGCAVTVEAILDHCRLELAAFKVPSSVTIVDAMPLGSTGKIDKNALRALLAKKAK